MNYTRKNHSLTKTFIASMLLLFLLVPVSCTSKDPVDSSKTSSQETPPANTGNLTQIGGYTFEASNYLTGETVYISAVLTNDSDSPVDLTPYPPEVSILSGTGDISKKIRTLDAGVDTKTIGPGQHTSFRVTWDQSDDAGSQVPYGVYVAQIDDLPDGVSSKVDASGNIVIKPVQGIMQKLIDVNDSIETGTGKLALEQVSLLDGRINLSGVYTPDLPQAVLQPSKYTSAECRIDNRATQYAGFSVVYPAGNRIQLFWTIFDVVASDATNLTFTITTLGDATGKWEFQVPLQ